MNYRKVFSLLGIVLISAVMYQCNTCDKPVYFQVAVVSDKSEIALDINGGEIVETRTINGSTLNPDAIVKLVDAYCSSDSLIQVKYTLNGHDTTFTVNRNQVKGCYLGDKVNRKPAVYFERRVTEADSLQQSHVN